VPSAPDELLRTDALTVGYARRALLPPVSFALAREELWALVGQNGAGKTTLLRTLLGLQPKIGGALAWVPGCRVGYVPQRAELDLSVPRRVRHVVAEGLDADWSFLRPGAARTRHPEIEGVLQEVGMAHLIEQPFAALSDGQRQRVLVARALAARPDVLVLDEPTNGMDHAAETAAFDLFVRLKSNRHLAVIVVSHHLAQLATRATHILWVDKDAKRVAAGAAVDVARDETFSAHYGGVFARGAA
jgi:ABC-type Mn2+/Zn2+ transport system ATPase subunit